MKYSTKKKKNKINCIGRGPFEHKIRQNLHFDCQNANSQRTCQKNCIYEYLIPLLYRFLDVDVDLGAKVDFTLKVRKVKIEFFENSGEVLNNSFNSPKFNFETQKIQLRNPQNSLTEI